MYRTIAVHNGDRIKKNFKRQGRCCAGRSGLLGQVIYASVSQLDELMDQCAPEPRCMPGRAIVDRRSKFTSCLSRASGNDEWEMSNIAPPAVWRSEEGACGASA